MKKLYKRIIDTTTLSRLDESVLVHYRRTPDRKENGIPLLFEEGDNMLKWFPDGVEVEVTEYVIEVSVTKWECVGIVD